MPRVTPGSRPGSHHRRLTLALPFSNPHQKKLTPQQIDKMVLEAQYLGDASMAPREYMTLTTTSQVGGWVGW